MVKRVDAYEKVTGRAVYADDIKMPGMLFAAQLYSSYPSAKINKIDVKEAKALAGVADLLTHLDVTGKHQLCGVIPDHYVFATDQVRYMGDVIALVVADSAKIAKEALKLIKVEYESDKPILDPSEAMNKDARQIHDGRNNVVTSFCVRHGNAIDGMKEMPLIVEREYKTSFVEHAYMEPESAVATPNADGSITVFCCTQHPFTAQKVVSGATGLELDRVQIIQTTLGGGFGGKDDTIALIASRLALAALKVKRPVKLTLTREESVRESYKRHPFHLKYKVGIEDKKIKAMIIDMTADSGPYCSTSPFVIWRPTVQCTGPYKVDHVHCDTRAVYTNNTFTGAMRGFGSPQVNFAIESMIDECAFACKMDPWEFRKLNFLKQGDTTHTGQRFDKHKVSIVEVCEKALTRFGWKEKFEKASFGKPNEDGNYYGVGFACSYRGVSLGAEGNDYCSAIVNIEEDGSVLLQVGVSENGQGLKTVMVNILSGELGISHDQIRFIDTDTLFVPESGPTVASRGTLVGGNAVIDAADKIKSIMQERLIHLIGSSDKYIFKDGKIINSINKKEISFKKVVQDCHDNKICLESIGVWKGPKVTWDEETGQGNPYFTYVYGCQVCEIEIDSKTKKISVKKVVAAHDVGKAINPQMAVGQIFGGIIMGLGFALMEKIEHKDGVIQNLNFNTYKIPKSTDVPEMEAILVENPDIEGPWGAKSLGEPTNELMGAAVANALFWATGKRIYELPIIV